MTLHLSDLAAKPELMNELRGVSAEPVLAPNLYRAGIKRALDLLIVLAALPFYLPFIVILGVVISLDGGSPFYVQKRIGKGGREFNMYKLRSMVVNADRMLADHLAADPAARIEWNATQKLKNDPRITRLGRFIRKVSLDELPQLINVIKGDMALVGPRPMMPDQKTYYYGTGYYRLRPGITGLWQVSDRNECEFTGRVRYDDEYDRTVSFFTDVRILFKTVWVVLRGTGY